jgi:hypothetical protein
MLARHGMRRATQSTRLAPTARLYGGDGGGRGGSKTAPMVVFRGVYYAPRAEASGLLEALLDARLLAGPGAAAVVAAARRRAAVPRPAAEELPWMRRRENTSKQHNKTPRSRSASPKRRPPPVLTTTTVTTTTTRRCYALSAADDDDEELRVLEAPPSDWRARAPRPLDAAMCEVLRAYGADLAAFRHLS